MKQDRHLTYEDRCQIDALLRRGISQAKIPRDLAVHRSTVSRELRRNSGKTGIIITGLKRGLKSGSASDTAGHGR